MYQIALYATTVSQHHNSDDEVVFHDRAMIWGRCGRSRSLTQRDELPNAFAVISCGPSVLSFSLSVFPATVRPCAAAILT